MSTTTGRIGSAPTVTGPYLRATVRTAERTLDVVLPTDQPLAELMPGLMELLSYNAEGMTCVLHDPSGVTVLTQRPLSHAGLRDGVVLRLVAEHEAPSEPVVADLLDVLESERTPSRWSARSRAWTVSSLGVLLVLCGMTLWVLAPGADRPWRLAAGAAVLWTGSALAATLGARPAAWSCAGAFGVAAAWSALL
ncbi:MAG: EsaB/YukD family protein, partial [Ornithinimicrobium sp.]